MGKLAGHWMKGVRPGIQVEELNLSFHVLICKVRLTVVSISKGLWEDQMGHRCRAWSMGLSHSMNTLAAVSGVEQGNLYSAFTTCRKKIRQTERETVEIVGKERERERK